MQKQMREEFVLWPFRVFHLHTPRTSCNNPQVGGLFIAQTLWVDSRRCGYRIYAVTLKNIPIAIGLALVTAAQCGLGIRTVVLSARGGGEIRSILQGNRSYSKHRHTLPQFCLRSPTATAYTPRHIPDVLSGTTNDTRENRICGPIPLLWCVRILVTLGCLPINLPQISLYSH